MTIQYDDVLLRDWSHDDAFRLADIANNEKIYANLRDAFPHPYTLENARDYINSCLQNTNALLCAIEYNGVLAGSIGAFFMTDVYRKNAEIGYYLAEEFWGGGIMTKAIKAISTYVFNNYDILRIYAEPFERNIGSRRALEKAGFFHEATLKKNVVKNGHIENTCIYSMLKDFDSICQSNRCDN